MTDTLTHIIREDACKLGDAHGWNTENSDAYIVYANKPNQRVIIIYPADNIWAGAPQRVIVSYRLADGTWNEVALTDPDVRWALTVFGGDPLAPYTEWAIEHGYDPRTPAEEFIRQQWHYQTGTGEAEDWPEVPVLWGEFNSWRSRAAR